MNDSVGILFPYKRWATLIPVTRRGDPWNAPFAFRPELLVLAQEGVLLYNALSIKKQMEWQVQAMMEECCLLACIISAVHYYS